MHKVKVNRDLEELYVWQGRASNVAPAAAVAVLLGVLGHVGVSLAQESPAATGSAEALPASALAGLQWRSIGPTKGGRSIAVTGLVGRPNEYYFGATGGGPLEKCKQRRNLVAGRRGSVWLL